MNVHLIVNEVVESVRDTMNRTVTRYDFACGKSVLNNHGVAFGASSRIEYVDCFRCLVANARSKS